MNDDTPRADLPQSTAEALELEKQIRYDAQAIRKAHQLDHEEGIDFPLLFLELWPLLLEPIPPAFIQTLPPTKGKPYVSTGIRSVQVQVDRMNNVLTPAHWRYTDAYELEGKLCTVTVYVTDEGGRILFDRASKGGVNQGSSIGNIYKGSWTNAAKLAFARIGPGHEVYMRGTDLDPDVSEDEANRAPEPDVPHGTIDKAQAKRLVDHATLAGVSSERLALASSKLAGKNLGDFGTKAKATKALTGALTFEQAEQLDTWLSSEADKKAEEGT